LESSSLRGMVLLRSLALTGLCAIQLDVPTFEDLLDRVQLKFVEHQLETSEFNQEELLKEGWLYYNLGQYEKARQFMEQAIADDKNISAYYCLGLIDMEYRQFENAITKFNIVAAKSPSHVDTRLSLGQAYYRLHYWGQAMQLEPEHEAARLWLGKTYLSLNQKERAKSILETVTHGQESMEAAVLLKSIH